VNVLIVGGGGREHALAWKIAQSPLVGTIICAPGNPGIAAHAQCIDIGVGETDRLVALAKDNDIGLAVIGPENPLADGIVDAFEAAGIKAFGPSKAAAQIEASKAFAKDIMARAHIPTAAYAAFHDPIEAIAYVREQGAPIVVKADGLAAGKGVTVAATIEEAVTAIESAMQGNAFGDAGARVVIEECLEGEEASILAFSDGTTVRPMASAQDHKPAFDGDTGPNTGGMGAYSPAPVVPDTMLEEIRRTVLQPCVDTMAEAGIPYRGILYAGLMITENGPKVIEFNCRFGDPEAQVVLPRLETDILPILLACCDGTLADCSLAWTPEACVTVVMASPGYPGDYPKGLPIHLDDSLNDIREGGFLFHAGTALRDGQLVTNGGRVLAVTAMGESISVATRKAYGALDHVQFEGAHYRTDIAQKALQRLP